MYRSKGPPPSNAYQLDICTSLSGGVTLMNYLCFRDFECVFEDNPANTGAARRGGEGPAVGEEAAFRREVFQPFYQFIHWFIFIYFNVLLADCPAISFVVVC